MRMTWLIVTLPLAALAAMASPTDRAATRLTDVDASVLSDSTELTLKTDGTNEIRYHYIIKILSEAGCERYAEYPVYYDGERDSVNIVRARTIKPDGTFLEVGQKAVNEVTRANLAVMDAGGAYPSLKKRVVSFPGVEKGCCLEIIYERTCFKPPMPGQIWGSLAFQKEIPIKEKTFSISVPLGIRLNFRMRNSTLQPRVGMKLNRVIYSWRAADVSPRLQERGESPAADFTPYLFYSTLKTWDDIGKWYSGLFYANIDPGAISKETAGRLVGEDDTREEAVKRLFKYVATEIRGLPLLNFGEGGYAPRPASKVISSGYGNCQDKVLLLSALLRSSGIESYPALVHWRKMTYKKKQGRYDYQYWWGMKAESSDLVAEAPSPEQFQYLVLAVPQPGRKNGYLFLDPSANCDTYPELPYGIRGCPCLVATPEGGALLETMAAPAEENLSQTSMSLKLGPDGTLSGKLDCRAKGYFDHLTREEFLFLDPKQTRECLLGAVSGISGRITLQSYSVSEMRDIFQQPHLTADFKCQAYGQVQGRLMLLELPKLPFEFARISDQLDYLLTSEDRSWPLWLESTMSSAIDISLELPRGYFVETIPPEMTIDNPIGHLKVSCRAGGDKIIWREEMVIDKQNIRPEEYQLLRQLQRGSLHTANRLVILKKK